MQTGRRRHDLDDLDAALLDRLVEDARSGPGPVAAAIGAPESTVRRRIAGLAAAGLLRTHATVDARLMGRPVDANIWITAPPGRLDAVGRALARRPEVHGVLASTGVTNLHAAVFCRDLSDLYAFTTKVLGGLDVPSAETTVVARAVKRAGLPHRALRVGAPPGP